MRCHRSRAALPCLLVAVFTLVFAIPSVAQDGATPLQESINDGQSQGTAEFRSLRCPAPSNPHRLPFECVGKAFDAIKETLTQDFAGYRTTLAGIGITSIHSYTAQFMGNPSGGRTQGFTYAGTLEALVAWDIHKLVGVPGLSFNIGASYASGKSLSAEYIDNVFTVQSAFSGKGNVNLQQMYLQQQLFDSAVTVAIGRLAPANTFAALPVAANYINGGINSVPGSLGINDPTFAASPPGVEWGTQAIYNLTREVQVAAGVFNTNPHAASGKDNGINFAFQQGNKGVLTVAQVSYFNNQARRDSGLPGEYTIGGFYDSNNFSSLSSPTVNMAGNYSLYAMFQQMIYREGCYGSTKGLTVWGEVAMSPKPSVSSVPYSLAGGFSYQGLIPGRNKDIASIGTVYGTFSGYIPQTSGEIVVESNYSIALTSWFSITPDLQYVMKPSGSSEVRNAVVLGAQLAVTF